MSEIRIEKLIFSVFLIAAVILFLPELGAADFSGLIVSVLDGDSIEVLPNQHPERIRLSGIDCPEKGQAYGKRAKQAASELAFDKEVTIQTHGHNKYKHTNWRRDPARWNESESGTRHAGLTLVIVGSIHRKIR